MSATIFFLFNNSQSLCPTLFHDGKSEQLKINNVLNSKATSLFIDKNDIYICGYYSFENRIKCGYWKNSVWYEIPTFATDTFLTSIYVENNIVYIGGYELVHFGNGTSKSYACYWKNQEYFRLNPYNDNVREIMISKVLSISVKANNVYCTGQIKINNKWQPGYWKNQSWISLSEKEGISEQILLEGDDIYVSGQLGNQLGYWKNGEWNGSDYSRLPYVNHSFYVDKIGVHQLLSKYTNSIPAPCILSNNKIESLPLIISNGIPSKEAYISNMVKVNNDVYIGGYCRHPISDEFVWVYWINNQIHKINIVGSINKDESFFIGVK